ncbi:MAG: alpha/beta fold hydrolase [Bacteroidota bacterium]
MKNLYLLFICWLSLGASQAQNESSPLNLKVLIGEWTLDMTPHDKTDSSFAMMNITEIEGQAFKGEFYREGVAIRNAQTHTRSGTLYGALISGDGTGEYHSTFYYKDGVLHGTTHAIQKNFLSVWTATKNTNQAFKPSFKISQKTTHKIPQGQTYTFGYLKVLENRQVSNSQTIELPVYIFKSRSKNPKKDPIIYTVGGPGASTMSSAQYMKYYKYLDDRDFILIEQRGTQYAKPHLACPEWAQAIYQSRLPNSDAQQTDLLFTDAAKNCRDRLIQQNIDLNGYNTNEIAADINDLVQVLDIQEYNLLTISYSTKIAQVLLRDYPDRIRSAVLDSPLPLEVNYDEESVQNLLATVDQLLADCEANEKCSTAFPNIKNRFHDYLKSKSVDPLVVSMDHPETGKTTTFYLKGEDLIGVFTLASTNEVASIPLEIAKLLDGDLTSVKKQLKYLFQKPGMGNGKGMRLSVWCAEEHPFNSQEIIAKERSKYPEVTGLAPNVFDAEVCEIWGVKRAAAIENQAVKSDIPVLLISGEYDNETPVKWAEAMRKNLSNSHHLVFKAWKHIPTTNWGDPCAMQAANDFFNAPHKKPEPNCLKQMKRPEFITE